MIEDLNRMARVFTASLGYDLPPEFSTTASMRNSFYAARCANATGVM